MIVVGISGRQQKARDKCKGGAWLVRYDIHSERLRTELALWVEILSNTTPYYASYWALNMGCCWEADKEPGVCSLACGEILIRLV